LEPVAQVDSIGLSWFAAALEFELARRLVATEWPQIAQTRAELVEGRSQRGMLRPRVRAGEAELADFEPNVSSGPSAA